VADLERAAMRALVADPSAGRSANKTPGLPPLRGGAEVYDWRAGEIRALVPDLLMDGVTLFVGKQKSGKSWLGLQLAVAIAGGPSVDGIAPTETGKVLYGALEEPAARTGLRLRKLGERGEWLDNLIFFYELLPLMGGGGDQLKAMIDQQQPRLIVLDSLTALTKAAHKRESDIFRAQYAEVDTLRRILQESCAAALIIHHTRKGAPVDVVEASAGTGGLTAAADTLWLLKRRPEGDAVLEVVGRELEDRSFALHLERETPFGWRFLGDGSEYAETGERREVLRLLREDGPKTPVQIAADLGKSRGGVRILLKRMAGNGLIVKRGERYHPVTPVAPLTLVGDVTGGVTDPERKGGA
jgi:hypothetical protein